MVHKKTAISESKAGIILPHIECWVSEYIGSYLPA